MKYELTSLMRRYLPEDLHRKIYNMERMLAKVKPGYRPGTHKSPAHRRKKGQQELQL